MTLGQSDHLKHGIIRYLARTIFSFADELRTKLKSPQEYFKDPHIHENMYYIFWCLEQLFQKELTTRSLVTLITPELSRQLQVYLDDAVLHVSEIYPMFVYYIWHITDLIRKLEQ